MEVENRFPDDNNDDIVLSGFSSITLAIMVIGIETGTATRCLLAEALSVDVLDPCQGTMMLIKYNMTSISMPPAFAKEINRIDWCFVYC